MDGQKQIIVLDGTNPGRAQAVLQTLGECCHCFETLVSMHELLKECDIGSVMCIIGAGLRRWTDGFSYAQTMAEAGYRVIIFSYRDPTELKVTCPWVKFDWYDQAASLTTLCEYVTKWLEA